MHHIRVKICGITRTEDMLAAVQAGADAIGFVFYEPSPRAVTVEQAAAIARQVPPFVSRVGLFVDAEPSQVRAVMEQVPLELLQFHGEETPDYCTQFGKPFLKAVRMREDTDLVRLAEHFAAAQGLLLDAYRPGVPGGTGEVFNWALAPEKLSLPWVLAGGLDADNVRQAIRQTHPWAVDVSGGVEALDATGKKLPGVKSAEAMHAFIRGAKGE